MTTTMTKQAIRWAVKANHAVIQHGRGNGFTTWQTVICDTSDEAAALLAHDTRGQCESMWDEVWYSRPTSVDQAIRGITV